eukprot:TRINITY_DN828_c0_g1_i2.p2 TRINITY_DN828_c0_g1~~TRINITY_DN828_c0_g1_i2.p2  ORF type:complete len:142 (-),score=42.73 TRINITY_DN828_c0_g1_i2:118-486(-)
MAQWDADLFGFLNEKDLPNCLVDGWICGACSSVVQRATAEGKKDPEPLDWILGLCCVPCSLWYTRQQVEKKYGIHSDPIVDAVLVLFCGPCTVQQQIHEMSKKGDKPCQFLMSTDSNQYVKF